jgi:hypothetical protein
MLTTNGTALTTLLQSKTLLDALDTMASYGQVTDSMNTLVLDVRANADQLAEVQSQQQHQEQQIEPEAIRNRNGALLNPGPRYRRPPTASERPAEAFIIDWLRRPYAYGPTNAKSTRHREFRDHRPAPFARCGLATRTPAGANLIAVSGYTLVFAFVAVRYSRWE